MKVNKQIILTVLALIFGLTACNMPTSQTQTLTPNEAAALTLTAGAQTLEASIPQASNTPVPTFTTPPDLPTSTTTSIPLPTAALQTATPSGTFFIVDVGANCRTGPGTIYDKIASFSAGTYVPLTGRIADSTWWYVLSGSTNCWISATTGHTTGNISSLTVIAAPPTPTSVSAAGPTLSDPVALVAELSYPSNCTSNTLEVAIRVTDAGKGINSVWLSYRYLGDGGTVGSWHTVTPNNNASGGVNGFSYSIGAEAAGELGTQNGTLQYQFFAKDNSGNITSYPNGSVLGMPIKHCP